MDTVDKSCKDNNDIPIDKEQNYFNKETDIEYVKKEINNLIWMYADGRTTLDEAESMALEILTIIRK